MVCVLRQWSLRPVATLRAVACVRSRVLRQGWISPITPSAMSASLDVMGFSHASAAAVASFHEKQPQQPLVMTECCSCETQRAWRGPCWCTTLPCGPSNSHAPPPTGCACADSSPCTPPPAGGEDADMPKGPDVYFDNNNSACVRGQTQASDAVAFDGGTFV